VKRLRGIDTIDAAVADDGLVEVDGHKLGHLEGLRFRADRSGQRLADRAVLNAATAALRPVLAQRAAAIAAAPDTAFTLDDRARIVWHNEAIALLGPGADRLKPAIQMLADERLEAADRLRIETRLRAWLSGHIARVLAPLMKAVNADVPGAIRGIIFQLAENGGAMARGMVDAQLQSLGKPERQILARHGIRYGREFVFLPALFKAAPVRLRGLLWIAAHVVDRDAAPMLPPPGRTSFAVTARMPDAFIAACGYHAIAGTAYRMDLLERFAADARKLAREKVVLLPPALLSVLGITAASAVPVLKALGFRAKVEEGGLNFAARRRHHGAATPPRPPSVRTVTEIVSDSPFAKLRALIPS
jgi:ATP-dependent RNA helicase SUPV3L1/SUV3